MENKMTDEVIFNIIKNISLVLMIYSPLNMMTIQLTDNKKDAITLFGWRRFIYPLYLVYVPLIMIWRTIHYIFFLLLMQPNRGSLPTIHQVTDTAFSPFFIFFIGYCLGKCWLDIEDCNYYNLCWMSVFCFMYFSFYAHVVVLIKLLKDEELFFYDKVPASWY